MMEELSLFEFIIAAIGIVIAIVLVIALAACAIAPLMMGDNNKSIVDQDCELGEEYRCHDCWKED
jgi:hypothetical protein